jgi:hypothetical protein
MEDTIEESKQIQDIQEKEKIAKELEQYIALRTKIKEKEKSYSYKSESKEAVNIN